MILLVLIGFAGLIIPQSFALNQEQSDSKIAYEFVLDDCINPGDFLVGHVFENATHYMDTMDCILFEKRMIKGPDSETAEKRILDNLPKILKSPLKQIKAGVATDKIQCNEGLKLIHRYNETPACVKRESIPKLAERGWISETDDHSLLALKKVQDSCANDSPKERMANILKFSNGTHVFMNLGCEWKKIGVYLGD